MTWVIANIEQILELSLEHVRLSILPIVLGFVIAIPLGWIAHRYQLTRGLILTLVGLLYTIPSLALFVILPPLLGLPFLSEANVLIALTIYAVAIMARSTADALASVDRDIQQAATAMGYSSWRRFWAVDFPLAGPVLLAGLRVVGRRTGHPCRLPIDLADSFLQAVVRQRHPGGVEAVRLDEVCACLQVRPVDGADDVGAGDAEDVVGALEGVGMVPEALAPEVVLAEAVRLDHRPHPAVQDEDAPGEVLTQECCAPRPRARGRTVAHRIPRGVSPRNARTPPRHARRGPGFLARSPSPGRGRLGRNTPQIARIQLSQEARVGERCGEGGPERGPRRRRLRPGCPAPASRARDRSRSCGPGRGCAP